MAPDENPAVQAAAQDIAEGRSHSVVEPNEQRVPLVFASPHSGQEYPADFIAASRLAPLSLRRSEDAFVDRLFAAAPRCGAPRCP